MNATMWFIWMTGVKRRACELLILLLIVNCLHLFTNSETLRVSEMPDTLLPGSNFTFIQKNSNAGKEEDATQIFLSDEVLSKDYEEYEDEKETEEDEQDKEGGEDREKVDNLIKLDTTYILIGAGIVTSFVIFVICCVCICFEDDDVDDDEPGGGTPPRRRRRRKRLRFRRKRRGRRHGGGGESAYGATTQTQSTYHP